MMPQLGSYAGIVLAAYAVSLVAIIGLVAWSLWQSARMRRVLRAVEVRQESKDV